MNVIFEVRSINFQRWDVKATWEAFTTYKGPNGPIEIWTGPCPSPEAAIAKCRKLRMELASEGFK